MTPDLRRCIDDLYEAFPDHREGRSIEGCQHCLAQVAEFDYARALGTADRRNVPGTALSWFAFRAMTTIGDASDLLSLLPPIFEKIADGSLGIYPQVIFGKLPMVGAETWPTKQRTAIEAFLLAWMGAATRERGVRANGPEVIECAAVAGFLERPKGSRCLYHRRGTRKVSSRGRTKGVLGAFAIRSCRDD